MPNRSKRDNNRNVDIGTVVYIFFAIFAPPFIPRFAVYVVGLLTIALLLRENNGVITTSTFRETDMSRLYTIYIVTCVYLIIIWMLNAIFGDGLQFASDVLHTLNQYLFLSGLEFLSVYYVIKRSERLGFGYRGIIEGIAYAGGIQGACAVLAYFVPVIRSFFLKYQDGTFRNTWHLLRRGYGFSSMMLDMFGYGMGLIAGIILLSNNIKGLKKVILQVLCLISVVLNARTGIVVYAISVMVYLFRSNTIKRVLVKMILLFAPLFLLVKYAVPLVMEYLNTSSSANLQWIGEGISSIYLRLVEGNGDSIKVLSRFDVFPDDPISFLFGTGNSVYDVQRQMNFHSDAGYMNLLWQIGIVGMVILLLTIIYTMWSCFKYTDSEYRYIGLFIISAYLVVLLKGRTVGYNAGIVVTYFLQFSTKYYSTKGLSKHGTVFSSEHRQDTLRDDLWGYHSGYPRKNI